MSVSAAPRYTRRRQRLARPRWQHTSPRAARLRPLEESCPWLTPNGPRLRMVPNMDESSFGPTVTTDAVRAVSQTLVERTGMDRAMAVRAASRTVARWGREERMRDVNGVEVSPAAAVEVDLQQAPPSRRRWGISFRRRSS